MQQLMGSTIWVLSIALTLVCIILIIQGILFGLGQYFNMPAIIQRLTALRLPKMENLREAPAEKGFSFKKMMLVIVSTRILIFIVVYLIDIFFYTEGYTDFAESFKRAWFIQDSNHYVSIAQDGYTNVGDDKRFIAFYPLYPLLIKVFSYVFQDYMVSGIIISFLGLIIACYFIMKLIMLEFENTKIAKGAIKYILIYPVTFFFSIVYTESLFLALTVMCFYFLRKREWLFAGICSLFASLTKNQGLLLIIPMLIEMFFRADILQCLKSREYKRVLRNWLKSGFYMLLCPAGFFIYLLVNKLVTGSWFMFMYYQKNSWSRQISLFADNLQFTSKAIFDPGFSPIFKAGTLIPTVLFFFAALFIIILSVRKMPLIYTIYSLAFLVVSYTPSWVISGPRYIMNIFPVFICLSMITHERKALRYGINIVCIIIMAALTGTFLFRIHFKKPGHIFKPCS